MRAGAGHERTRRIAAEEARRADEEARAKAEALGREMFTGEMSSRKAGDSKVFRRMEEDALKYARLGVAIGVPLAVVGVAGWLATRWMP